MYKSIIFVMILLLFGGCTINMAPTQELVEKKIPAQIELKQYKLWPHVKKEYWYAKYFLTMAMNPNVQRMLTPEQVFAVVKCTVDGFERDYDYEQFLEKIGDNLRLSPQMNKYVYDTSLVCSQEVQRKMKEEQSKKPLTLKETI
jgi:PBP1b-binding outer membrane lipoprotein LpoB